VERGFPVTGFRVYSDEQFTFFEATFEEREFRESQIAVTESLQQLEQAAAHEEQGHTSEVRGLRIWLVHHSFLCLLYDIHCVSIFYSAMTLRHSLHVRDMKIA
jgi:hypothetical protein